MRLDFVVELVRRNLRKAFQLEKIAREYLTTKEF
jgi:hypothetical protein